jgi:hypothetical protein
MLGSVFGWCLWVVSCESTRSCQKAQQRRRDPRLSPPPRDSRHPATHRSCSHAAFGREGASRRNVRRGAPEREGLRLEMAHGGELRLCCLRSKAPATLHAVRRVCAPSPRAQHFGRRRTSAANPRTFTAPSFPPHCHRPVAAVVLHTGANGCAISRHAAFELARGALQPHWHSGAATHARWLRPSWSRRRAVAPRARPHNQSSPSSPHSCACRRLSRLHAPLLVWVDRYRHNGRHLIRQSHLPQAYVAAPQQFARPPAGPSAAGARGDVCVILSLLRCRGR